MATIRLTGQRQRIFRLSGTQARIIQPSGLPLPAGSFPPLVLPDPPGQVQSLVAVRDAVIGNRINLAWDATADSNGYRVERSTVSGSGFVQIADIAAIEHADTDLDYSTDYFYRVRAYNAGGNGPYSAEASASTLGVPAAPSNLVATQTDTDTVTLTWQDNSDNEDGFSIERDSGAGFGEIDTTAANVESYLDTPLAEGAYSYRARAFNAAGNSDYSNTDEVEVIAQPSFTGAYDDISNIAALYGFRRLLTSYESNLIRLRRSSDNDELDIGYVDNGDLDTDAAATFIGAGSGFITTWYDQSGNGFNATQATAASQPLYVASGQNGRPVARFDGSDDDLVLPSGTYGIANGNNSAIAVAKSNAAGGRIFTLSVTGNSRYFLGYASSNPEFQCRTTFSPVTGMGTLDMAVTVGIRNGTAQSLHQDGSLLNSNTGGQSVSDINSARIGSLNSQSAFLNGDMAELVIANAVWSTADREAAEQAANAYFEVYE